MYACRTYVKSLQLGGCGEIVGMQRDRTPLCTTLVNATVRGVMSHSALSGFGTTMLPRLAFDARSDSPAGMLLRWQLMHMMQKSSSRHM